MAILASIENNTWGISTIGYGVIAEGIALIRQRLDIVIRTSKGSDPMRPEFGSHVYKYIDAPLNIAIPNIKLEIITALEMWMPEIKVISIVHTMTELHNPLFAITYRVLDDTIVDKLLFDIKQGTTTSPAITEILLQAFFPPNPNAYRYQIHLIRNSEQVNPLPPPAGFATLQSLVDWVMAHWYFWGRWYLLTDRLVCYMNSDGVTNASLSISLLSITQISANLPTLEFGELYKVVFKVNGSPVTPEMPQTFFVPEQVLLWARENWADYGTWSLASVQANENTEFSDEFSSEFDSPLPDTFKLILNSSIEGFTGELQITTV